MTNFDETKTIDAETLWNTPIPPVRWVVPDLLPAGLSILAGASKAGKSWLCLWLCLQIARGGQVWGRQPQPAVPDPQRRHRAGVGGRDHHGAETPPRHRSGGH